MKDNLQIDSEIKEKGKEDNYGQCKKFIKHKAPMKKARTKQKFEGILKSPRRRLVQAENKNTVKWNASVAEENNSREQKLNSDRNINLLNSQTVYEPYEGSDKYLINLNKVNQIKASDDIIKNVIKALNEPKLPKFKKSNTKGHFIRHDYEKGLHLKAINSVAEKEHIIDDDLDQELKLTLKNTLINKFHKQVCGNNAAKDIKAS